MTRWPDILLLTMGYGKPRTIGWGESRASAPAAAEARYGVERAACVGGSLEDVL